MPAGNGADRNLKSGCEPFSVYFEALLQKPDFQISPRRNELLRYLVDKSLSGQVQTLSEYAIALEVFRKPESFDQRIDSTVRSEISRLRRFVAGYYEGSGANDPWQIAFPARGYVPQVVQVQRAATPVKEQRSPQRFKVSLAVPVAAGAILVAVLIAGAFGWGHHEAKVLASTPIGTTGGAAHGLHAVNPEAKALFLKGQYYWEHRTEGSLNQAVDAYTQAIVADSDYAEAYAGLAASYDVMPEYSSMPQEEAFRRAISAANKAVSLNPSVSIAHRALAFALFWSQTDIPRAMIEFTEAIRLAPEDPEAHHWYATALNSILRTDEARREIDKAQQLAPASRSILADQAWIRYASGDSQAIAKLEELESAEPDFRSPAEFLARIDLMRGNYIGYLEQLHRLAKISGTSQDSQFSEAAQKGWDSDGKQGMLRAMKAIQEQAFASNQSDGYGLAWTCALLGEREQATKYLQSAFAAKDLFVLDTLRPDWAPQLNGFSPFEKLRTQIRSRFGIART